VAARPCFLLRLYLDHIDALDAAIGKIDHEVEAGNRLPDRG